MSWFGETFGDSLNSLKGQITKIKEVLVDDEAASSETQEPEINISKELKALCQSKDLEIAALKDELNKIRKTQLELSKAENSVQPIKDDDKRKIENLDSKLIELRNERDHLNSCLEELQVEHQTNLDQVISLKDKYRNELEVLKKDYDLIKTKLNEVLKKEASNEDKDAVSLLNAKVKELELLLVKEKEKSELGILKEKETQNSLKDQLNKLVSNIELISEEKKKLIERQEFFQNQNENLKSKLTELEKELKENETKVAILLNEKKELLNKCQNLEAVESKLSVLMKIETQVQEKLKNLLHILNISVNDVLYENIIELLNLIEIKCEELNDRWKQSENKFETELRKLLEENSNYQNRLMFLNENKAEMEKKYQEEISLLRSSFSEMKVQEQECINQSQTDDVKRLEQEVAQCTSLILLKNNEIIDCSKKLKNLEAELMDLKASSLSVKEELLLTKAEKSKLEDEVMNLKNIHVQVSQDKLDLEEKFKILESDTASKDLQNKTLQSKIYELEQQSKEVSTSNEKCHKLEEELEKAETFKSEIQKKLEESQEENLNLKKKLENLKSEVTLQESRLVELMKTNTFFQEEMNKLQTQNNELMNLDKEIMKWKDASVDLQIQLEDLILKKEELQNEYIKLKNESIVKESELQQLKLANSDLMKSCSEFQCQVESKAVAEQSFLIEKNKFKESYQKQEELILQLQEENCELKSRIQKFQEQMKLQMFQQQSHPHLKNDVLQHRRSKSDVDTESVDVQKSGTSSSSEELMLLKLALHQEQAKYQDLLNQFQEISNKEVGARKEFERLKQHLIEVEDHYTQETVENEKIINDLKSKLIASEEQLQNSSTLYTSLKVRDNQHLESLQSQIRMVSAQRDDFQTKLSAAEDEVQKHKASLMSLQIVLEQFQQDKERDVEQLSMEYEKKIQFANYHFRELEEEIQGLKNQLSEAKNGLKAASRLGEQLEKKTQQVSELEKNLDLMNNKMTELENNLASANQANNGKVDKLLIKNLITGYVLSVNNDRKLQVLRIMASVLDFDQDEKTKMGIDANRSGWLSNILHPKGDTSSTSQSLSEAFIRFLENESRPTPQLRLLPEQYETSVSKTSRSSPKPSSHLSELMLPTFSSSQENESSIILKNVLKDS